MINNIYAKIKDFLINNYKEIIFLILFYIALTFPLPYYIYFGGGTIDLNDRYTVENANKINGSYNLAYVSEIRATTTTYLLSYILPDWERIKIDDYKRTEEESAEDILTRNKLALENANQTAIYFAYSKANKEIETIKSNNYIIYIDKSVEANLKIGDIILKADDTKIDNIDTLRNIIEQKEVNDVIQLTLLRNKKETIIEIKVQLIDNQKKIGIDMVTINEYKSNPKINLNFKKSETGSSGGLMLTLSIYDSLSEEDLSNNLKIVGTGTIDENGNVGEIGGVKYKLKGAVKGDADIFIVPYGNNYEECLKLQKENNYNIKIIGVKTFDEAIEELKKIKE